MLFRQTEHAVIGRQENETLMIEAWGNNALRVRSTHYPKFEEEDWALDYVKPEDVHITIETKKAVIRNGKIHAELTDFGELSFYKEGKKILMEYYRTFGSSSTHSPSLKIKARQYLPILGGDYELKVRFESCDEEKIYGMGQYQQPYLDLKGCNLELAQRNSQISIPFAISNQGYGFLWNNPAIGEASFGKNYTQWQAKVTKQMDYWITADDTPRQIIENYTQVTGRTPMMPDSTLGLWQCKLRYRTQDEVLEVAREYKRRGIPLDIIIIDFFHWIHQGDWGFDPKYWPNPKEMVQELKEMGTRCMVSVWPTVDKQSVNFDAMKQKGLLIRAEKGAPQTFDVLGDTIFMDATNPEAREYVWEQVKKNYYDNGVDMFWLDVAEPEYTAYDFDQYRYYLGPNLRVGNIYPRMFTMTFYEGLKAQGREDIVNLVRCAWAGSQKYAALVWSGDIHGNFDSLRDQLAAGLNMGLAGIPWWVSDTGGFIGDKDTSFFNELLIRWFQFSTFCPVLRMHGDRGPHNIEPLDYNTIGGGFCGTGQPNELWSYGEEVYLILKKYLDIRISMKAYIKEIMEDAHRTGAPVIRTMFFEFPEDTYCWEITDQYMFGSQYLVAPILYEHMTKRTIYLPRGIWKSIHDGTVYEGGTTIMVEAPLSIIPVYHKEV
ncbi:MAG: family 31 glucosidase [Herbinix sp.]|jgi:alpha-D-xyloside xylohydrolase|nr:family 31 glucosidase [Herbinix sp.]